MKRDYLEEIKKFTERRVHPDEILSLNMAKNENRKLIAIGASTGGVDALVKIFSKLDTNLPPILLVQHIPATFAKSFIERLDRVSPIKVKEAVDGEYLQNSCAYIASNEHLSIENKVNGFAIKLIDAIKVSGHRPSIDILMRSVANSTNNALAIILTGMGDDGAIGMKDVYESGSYTVAQDERSCIVYGMPKHIVDNGHAKEVLNLSEIANKINRYGE